MYSMAINVENSKSSSNFQYAEYLKTKISHSFPGFIEWTKISKHLCSFFKLPDGLVFIILIVIKLTFQYQTFSSNMCFNKGGRQKNQTLFGGHLSYQGGGGDNPSTTKKNVEFFSAKL